MLSSFATGVARRGLRNVQRWGAAVLVLLGCGTAAFAQYPVDQRVNMGVQPTGRLMDANPDRYGTGSNYSRPISPLVGGNPYATGNVGRGLSLRSYSPISDPSTFSARLGTSDLFAFRRDSVSMGDAASPLGNGFFAQPYYDPSRTAAMAGFLQGPNNPSRTAQALVPRELPLDLRVPLGDSQRGLYSQIVSPGAPPTLPSLTTSSSIFGPGQTQPRLALPLVADEQFPSARRSQEEAWPGVNRDSRLSPTGLADGSSLQSSAVAATPLDFLLRGDSVARLGRIESGAELPPWAGGWRDGQLRPGLIVPEVGPEAARGSAEAGQTPPRPVDPSVLPGFDVFTDMRLALELSRDPGARWFQEMQEAARSQPNLLRDTQKQMAQDAEQFVDRVMKTPLRTFTGSGSSEFNDQMLRAESSMDIGMFQEAADRYDRAHRLDPINPLPLIGKGHALLAMGSYSSAADSLIRGLERFPEVSRFPFELRALMGSGENIDIRRADIMKRLEQREAPELRFLLGYMEYHTGDREHGLANLEKAARDPRAGAFIARYPDMLRGQGVLPPPKISDDGSIEPGLHPAPLPSPTRGSQDEVKPAPSETLVVPPPVE